MSNPRGHEPVEQFGAYEVYEQLGVGGMAKVHRAKKQGIEGFQRVVALKRLLSHLATDESFVKSFVREARLASYLQHANIIQIYDLGRVESVYFIAMEFVQGHDLRKLLKQTAYATGPMPVSVVMALSQQLCDALNYAHTRTDENGEALGIVHRDISPSNLLVSGDGHLKIIDFGIAKASTATLRTQSGRVKGKYAYMSPEAIRGKPLDHRSDLFAAGIVMYEMLTARPLFASKSEFDTLHKITKVQVEPPSRYNPDCPPDLDDIVLTALAKTPQERWQSAGAMLRALEHVSKKLSLQATSREIAEWVEWSFAQPLQSRRVEHVALREAPTTVVKRSALTSSVGPPDMSELDRATIEMVWGNQDQLTASTVPVVTPAQSAGSQRLSAPRSAAQPVMAASADLGDRSSPVPRVAMPGDGSQPVARWPQGTPPGPGPQGTARAPATPSPHPSTLFGLAPPPGVTTSAPGVLAQDAGAVAHASPVPPDARRGKGLGSTTAAATLVDRPAARRDAGEMARPALASADHAAPAAKRPGTPPLAASARSTPGSREAARTRAKNARGTDGKARRRPLFWLGLLVLLCAGGATGGYFLIPSEWLRSIPSGWLSRDDGPASRELETGPRSAGSDAPTAVLVDDARDDTARDDAARKDDTARDDAAEGNPVPEVSEAGAQAEDPASPDRALAPETDEIETREVPAGQVKRASGKTLRLPRSQRKGRRTIQARMCIDEQGQVTSVELLDAPRAAVTRARRTLEGWRYRPYLDEGVAVPVCFTAEIDVRK